MWNFVHFNSLDIVQQRFLLEKANQILKNLSAEDRVIWGLKHLPSQIILTSSFGLQSVVSLRLITYQCPDVPIIFIDTGYLFPETYRYVDLLTKDMKLNLYVFSSICSPAWQEARYGRLWEKGLEGINQYNYINKVEPMRRAFKDLKVQTWFSGLRKIQSSRRKKLEILSFYKGVFKLLPILDWEDHTILKYIKVYSLIFHPLWNKGYISLGDVHTTRKYQIGMRKEETRFFGLKRECGLHEDIF